MTQILIVGLGGFLGSVFRFLLAQLTSSTHHPIPFSTLGINLLGSFLIGIMLSLAESKLNQNLFIFLVPGLLGGFTTYSAFSGEVFLLMRQQSYVPALIYIASTVMGGLLLTALGYFTTKQFLTIT